MVAWVNRGQARLCIFLTEVLDRRLGVGLLVDAEALPSHVVINLNVENEPCTTEILDRELLDDVSFHCSDDAWLT